MFEALRLRAVRGALATADGAPVRGVVELRVGEDVYLSALGNDGAFEFLDVPAGRWAGRASGCGFTLEVPDRGEPILDLGAVRCEVTP